MSDFIIETEVKGQVLCVQMVAVFGFSCSENRESYFHEIRFEIINKKYIVNNFL